MQEPKRSNTRLSRREFLALAAATAAGCATRPGNVAARESGPSRAGRPGDTIRLGVIGCGAAGTVRLQSLLLKQKAGAGVRVVAVSDIYAPRNERAQAMGRAEVHHDWREVVDRTDIDAVVIATPNHWHAPMMLAAMEAQKDVYCESPMALTAAEAKRVRDCARQTERVVQIGAALVGQGSWQALRGLVADGALGTLHRTQAGPVRKWLRLSESEATPDTLDWEAFLGDAPPRPFDPDRFFHWSHYWDYSGGIATDRFYPVVAAFLAAAGAALPHRVSAAGGVAIPGSRETPDMFMATIEYPGQQTLVLTSSQGNRNGPAAVVHGEYATVDLYDQKLIVHPERQSGAQSARPLCRRHGTMLFPPLPDDLLDDWLACIRSRETCLCNPDLAHHAMVAVDMSVEAYRKRKTLCFDPETQTSLVAPPRVAA